MWTTWHNKLGQTVARKEWCARRLQRIVRGRQARKAAEIVRTRLKKAEVMGLASLAAARQRSLATAFQGWYE
jgi:hypothetical protein